MKKFAVLIFMALLVPLNAMAQAKWVEGENYTVLNKPLSKKPEVTEFFSFWCSHCYRFEPVVASLKKNLPAGVKFNKVHVNFMRFTTSEVQDMATTAMAVGKASKQSDKMNAKIFDYIHKQRGAITNINDLRNIFIINGMEGEEFDKLAKSFGVNSMLKKNNKHVDNYKQYVNGVPNFIVNGKYQANLQGLNPDEIVELMVYLTTLR